GGSTETLNINGSITLIEEKIFGSNLVVAGLSYAMVRWFAVGDGSADDTIGIQNCINSLSDNSRVTFNGGNYLSTRINIDTKNNVIFEGNGSTIQLSYGVSFTALFDIDGCQELDISGFDFVGTSDTDPLCNDDYRAIDVRSSSFTKIHHNTFSKISSNGIFARILNGGNLVEGVLITDNTFKDFSYDQTTPNQSAVTLSEDAEYSIVSNNFFFRVPSAIRFIDGANSSFINNMVLNSNGDNWDGTLLSDRAAVFATFT
ncbi:unnamed protein product, partial [marine sediment metagenome]